MWRPAGSHLESRWLPYGAPLAPIWSPAGSHLAPREQAKAIRHGPPTFEVSFVRLKWWG